MNFIKSIVNRNLLAMLLFVFLSGTLCFTPSTAIGQESDPRLEGSGEMALMARSLLLDLAITSWLFNNSGISESELQAVSIKGFLPFWVNDPLSGEPVKILREQDPHGTEIAYWPVKDVGWDFSDISSLDLSNATAEPYLNEKSALQAEFYQLGTTYVDVTTGEPAHQPSSDWESLIWSLMETNLWVVNTYLEEHDSLPASLDELLKPHYLLNEDFINRVETMLESDHSLYFEFGSIPDMDIIYLNYPMSDGTKIEIIMRAKFGSDGNGLTHPTKTLNFSGGIIPEDAVRITFLSNSIIADHQTLIADDLIKPLSAFYSANQ